MTSRPRAGMVVAVLAAVALVVALTVVWRGSLPIGDGSAPLRAEDDARLVLHLKGDRGLVDDIDPGIPLANPTEHPVRITGIELIRAPDSPGEVSVRTFRLAGPDRTTPSIPGGLLGEKHYGAPLLSAEDAVIPPGAKNRDYLLLVRVAGDPDTDWSGRTPCD